MRTIPRLAALLAVLLLAGTAGTPAQSSVVGDWEAVFVGPTPWRPKSFGTVTFSIRDTPNGLAGAAQAGSWPGDLQLSDLTVVGDRISFVGTGKLWWRTMRDGVFTEFCCPKLIFEGKMRDDQIDLTMIWTSTDPRASEKEAPVPMLAKRVTK
jgi:hypothetical protein